MFAVHLHLRCWVLLAYSFPGYVLFGRPDPSCLLHCVICWARLQHLLCEADQVMMSNIAAACLKLKRFRDALETCNEALRT